MSGPVACPRCPLRRPPKTPSTEPAIPGHRNDHGGAADRTGCRHDPPAQDSRGTPSMSTASVRRFRRNRARRSARGAARRGAAHPHPHQRARQGAKHRSHQHGAHQRCRRVEGLFPDRIAARPTSPCQIASTANVTIVRPRSNDMARPISGTSGPALAARRQAPADRRRIRKPGISPAACRPAGGISRYRLQRLRRNSSHARTKPSGHDSRQARAPSSAARVKRKRRSRAAPAIPQNIPLWLGTTDPDDRRSPYSERKPTYAAHRLGPHRP